MHNTSIFRAKRKALMVVFMLWSVLCLCYDRCTWLFHCLVALESFSKSYEQRKFFCFAKSNKGFSQRGIFNWLLNLWNWVSNHGINYTLPDKQICIVINIPLTVFNSFLTWLGRVCCELTLAINFSCVLHFCRRGRWSK